MPLLACLRGKSSCRVILPSNRKSPRRKLGRDESEPVCRMIILVIKKYHAISADAAAPITKHVHAWIDGKCTESFDGPNTSLGEGFTTGRLVKKDKIIASYPDEARSQEKRSANILHRTLYPVPIQIKFAGRLWIAANLLTQKNRRKNTYNTDCTAVITRTSRHMPRSFPISGTRRTRYLSQFSSRPAPCLTALLSCGERCIHLS